MSVTEIPYEDPGQHPTEAVLGYTTSLQFGDSTDLDAVTTWTDLGEVRDLTVWDASRDTVEVTNHRSPGWAVETIPALINWGSCSFDLNAVPRHMADPTHPQGRLLAAFRSAGNSPWRVVFPDGTSVRFLASLTSFSMTAPVTDVLQASCELSLSGDPIWEPSGVTDAGGGNGAGGASGQIETGPAQHQAPPQRSPEQQLQQEQRQQAQAPQQQPQGQQPQISGGR